MTVNALIVGRDQILSVNETHFRSQNYYINLSGSETSRSSSRSQIQTSGKATVLQSPKKEGERKSYIGQDSLPPLPPPPPSDDSSSSSCYSPGDSILGSPCWKNSRKTLEEPYVRPSVQFNSTIVSHESPYSQDLSSTAYEPRELWHTSAEYRTMREREIKVIKKVSSMIPKCAVARDGIETIAYRNVRRKRTDEAKLAVLKEQDDCRKGRRFLTPSMEQQDYIREAYSKCSKMAEILANTRGETTAVQVKNMW